MTQPLFDPEKCDVENVPSLDFDFVEDCSIAGPPPPIYDCQLPIVPREPPPPLCPEFTGAITVTSVFENCSGAVNSTIVFTKIDDEPCRVALDLDLAIPLPQPPCPVINAAAVLNYGGTVATPLLALSVTPTTIPGVDCSTPDTCQFDIDLQLDLPGPPCPEITASGSIAIEPGRENPSMAFTVTKNAENCEFALDVDIALPPPPPCPEISGTISVTPASTPTGTILISATPPETAGDPCQFAVDIDIGVPVPCTPDITISGSILQTPGIDSPSMAVGVSGPGPSDCNYGINVDIELPSPRPCPDITGDITVYEAPALTGAVAITTVPTASETDACQFAIDIEIGIPAPPEPPCIPELTVSGSLTQTPGREEPTMAVTLSNTGASGCDKTLNIDIELPTPRPCPTFTGSVDVQYGTPGGTLVITHSTPTSATDACDYALDLSLFIPDVCTPSITATSSIIETTGRETPWMQFTSTPGATGCSHELEIEIELPTPRPCPTFTGAVTVYESNTATGAISITHSTPASRTAACAYAIDVAVGYQRTRIEKGTVAIGLTACDVPPTCNVTIHPPNASGVQLLDLDIRIPSPPTYTGGALTLKDAAGAIYGTGSLSVPTAGCTRGVSGVVTLNTTSCGPYVAGGL
jgi:hypothetical protein